MRRMLFVVLVGAALLAVGPATALGRQGHHQRRHGHHARRHSRVHHRRFGSDTAAPGEDTAGSVASFSDGVLTITLNDGSTVSGRVTDATEMQCEAAENENFQNDSRSSSHGGSGGGDDNGGNNDSGGSDDNGDNGDQNDEQGENGQACSPADLTPGATVQDAELKVSSAGSVWQKLELAR